MDSDSFLDMFAIRNLVQPFRDPKMGGVSGRTDVANAYTNGLTKMQAVRYYIAFRIMKAAESVFDTVTCLSGPLSCYRKDIVLENLSAWRNQKFLGQRRRPLYDQLCASASPNCLSGYRSLLYHCSEPVSCVP